MASRPDSTKRVLKNIRRVSTVKVEKVELIEGSNTILLKKKIAIEKFLSNFRTAMAVSGEVKIFEATFPFEASSDNELTLKVGDQCLAHGDGSDENAEWIFCEHENGNSGWCPRHSGVFLAFAEHLTRGNKMKLRPADGCRGVYGLSEAFPGLDKRIKDNILAECLKTIALGEYEFTKELLTVIDKFITPMEQRDTKAKVKLLEDPYLSIFISQYKDICYNHCKFYQSINVENLSESKKLLLLLDGLSKLIPRFPMYETFLSVGAMTFHVLDSPSKKKPYLNSYLSENPLPEGSKNILNLLASPRQRYQAYKPLLELILRCLDDENGNDKNDIYKKMSLLYVETSKATATVDLFLKRSNDEAEVLAVQQMFVGKVNIFTRGRRLLHTDKLFKVHSHGGAKEQRVVHLFNDVIIYSIQVGNKLQFRKSLSLLKCEVRDVSDSLNGVNLFDLVDSSKPKNEETDEPLPQHKTRFLAHSKEVKAMWMELIKQQTARLQERIEALNKWDPSSSEASVLNEKTIKMKEKLKEFQISKPVVKVEGDVADDDEVDHRNSIGIIVSPTGKGHKSNGHNVALFLADFNGQKIQHIITEVQAFVDANYKSSMKRGIRFQPIFNLLSEHLKICKSFVSVVAFFAAPLISISRGLGDGLKHHSQTQAHSVLRDSSCGGVYEGGEETQASEIVDDTSDSEDEVIGTRTSVGRTFEILRRAISIDQVALLHRPDVLVTLQTIVDMNQSFSSFLTELYELVKNSDDSGDSIALSKLPAPFPDRLFETYAWSYGHASKVLFASGAFTDLILKADIKLKMVSGMSVQLFLDDFLKLEKYHIYIPHIAKLTPTKHKDYLGGQALSNSLTQCKFKIRDTLNERKNFDKLTQIQLSVYSTGRNRVMDTLVSRNRKFIREGTIRKVCRGGKIKPFAFWLLSDLLIYASPLSASGKYKLNHTIDLLHTRPLPCTYTMPGNHGGGGILDELNTPELKKKKSNLNLNKTKTVKPKLKNNISLREEDVDPMGLPVEDYGLFTHQCGDLVPGIEIFATEKTFIALFVSEKERNDWMRDIRNACIASGGSKQQEFRSEYDKKDRPKKEIENLEVVGMVERTVTNEKGKITNSWIDYELKVSTYGGTSWTVHKRYSMLLEFHKSIKKKTGCGAIDNFPFPKKSVLQKTGKRLQDQIKNTFHLYFRLFLQLEIRPDELRLFLEDASKKTAGAQTNKPTTTPEKPKSKMMFFQKDKVQETTVPPPATSKKSNKVPIETSASRLSKASSKDSKKTRSKPNSKYNGKDIEATAL